MQRVIKEEKKKKKQKTERQVDGDDKRIRLQYTRSNSSQSLNVQDGEK